MSLPSLFIHVIPNSTPPTPMPPYSVKPDKPLTYADVMALNRDHYEGSQFDLTRGLAAGPYGDPQVCVCVWYIVLSTPFFICLSHLASLLLSLSYPPSPYLVSLYTYPFTYSYPLRDSTAPPRAT